MHIDTRDYPDDAMLVDGALLTHDQAMWVASHFVVGPRGALHPDWEQVCAYAYWVNADGTMVDPQRRYHPDDATVLTRRYDVRYRRATPTVPSE